MKPGSTTHVKPRNKQRRKVVSEVPVPGGGHPAKDSFKTEAQSMTGSSKKNVRMPESPFGMFPW